MNACVVALGGDLADSGRDGSLITHYTPSTNERDDELLLQLITQETPASY